MPKKPRGLQGLMKDELVSESLPGKTILEFCGDNRLLIEKHKGVYEYGLEEVQVGVSFGKVVVQGMDLKLACMSRLQVVITGQIYSLQLIRE